MTSPIRARHLFVRLSFKWTHSFRKKLVRVIQKTFSNKNFPEDFATVPLSLDSGADLGGGGGGGGGGADASPQGFDPLPTQRVPPLILFQKSIFGGPTLKFF